MSESKIADLVRWLTDRHEQPWTRTMSIEDCASRTLAKMVEIGIIEGRHHPHTSSQNPTVFRVGTELFGRVDEIDQSLFE